MTPTAQSALMALATFSIASVLAQLAIFPATLLADKRSPRPTGVPYQADADITLITAPNTVTSIVTPPPKTKNLGAKSHSQIPSKVSTPLEPNMYPPDPRGCAHRRTLMTGAMEERTYTPVIEWHNFIGGNQLCLKACNTSYFDDYRL
ncbi:hypothetical protein BDQ17DRAFT_1425042 [Cyathus striatus]|nr:hypothetical protein BDQ17DRAFT_1425042 [Cyathus striatus]